jgi:hypothetical protein
MSMILASIIHQYRRDFEQQYAKKLLPSHRQAINAITRCRTPSVGEVQLHCHDCNLDTRQPQSCGHRSCPQCQNHAATQWLDRQQQKLLPVDYFMIAFTLPYELRPIAWRHQSVTYQALFEAAISTLKDFGDDPKHLGAEFAMTAVLHTHSRRLDFHPHLHVIVPGGGLLKARRQWKKVTGQYLFNAFALSHVFRARMLAALNDAGLPIPAALPKKWVVDVTSVGTGKPALAYLSAYLYRGVIREKNIIAHQNGTVTFNYIDGATGDTRSRTLRGPDFLWLVLQHVLPKGFRRVRDYGFLHGNAKKTLNLVQLVLRVIIDAVPPRTRPVFKCPKCRAPMRISAFIKATWLPG